MKKITARTRKLQTIDKEHLWHPFTRMLEWEGSAPIVIEKARGNYLIDTDGNRYLDCNSSLWVNLHGHRRAEIDRAIKAQLAKISHSTLLGLSNTTSIELAEELIKIAPKGLNRVFYSDNGSTAVEIALKMAFYYWTEKLGAKTKKKKFIAFTGAYHGDTVGSMSVGEIDVFVSRYKPLIFDSFRAPYPYCYRCPLKDNYPKCGLACLDEFEKIIAKNHKEIAACIIEPHVQGASGMITTPTGFMKGIRRLTKKYNILLIADEVATAFGRTGEIFACDIEGIHPDLMCLAKGITGGYLPLGATLTTEKIYRSFLGTAKAPDAFYHGHTYTGNQLGCAASLANLSIFKKDKVIKNIQPKIALLKERLKELTGLKHVGDVRQQGLMCAVELVSNKASKRRYPASMRIGRTVCDRATHAGMMIRSIQDTIIIIPPLTIKENEIKKLVSVLKDSIIAVTDIAQIKDRPRKARKPAK